MRRRTKVAIWSIVAFLFVGSGLAASLAWFDNGRNEVDVDVTGSVVEEYFHCGDGSQSNPYVITRPIHYYHLVEFFQRETTLTRDDTHFGTDYLYFQVGYDIDNDGDLEVYSYDDQGIYQGTATSPSYSTTLNMAYYSGTNALLPVGTNEIPFIGSFNGNAPDITIANLNIHCAETVQLQDGTVVNRSASDIGVFGYIADKDGDNIRTVIQNAYFDGLTIDLSDVSMTVASSVTSASHEAAHADEAYVGLIAGHVHTYTNYSSAGPTNASPLSNVYATNASIQGGAGVKCNYGYIGKVDTVDGETSATVTTEVNEINVGHGGGNRFGGSIDMLSLYERLKRTYNGPAVDNGSYESVTYDYDNGAIVEGGKVENLSNHFSNYHDEDFSYTFNKHNNGSQDFYYLYGNLDFASGGTRTSSTHFFENKTTSGTGFKFFQENNQCYFSATSGTTTYYLVVPQQSAKPTSGSLAFLGKNGFVTTNEQNKTVFDVKRSGNYYLIYTRQTIGSTTYYVQLGGSSSSLSFYFNTSLQNPTNSNTYRLIEDGNGYWYRNGVTGGQRLKFNTSTTQWYYGKDEKNNLIRVDDTMDLSIRYLKIEDASSLSTTSSLSEAAIWVIDGDKIYSIMALDGKYYRFYLLGFSTGLTISRFESSASATSWATNWSSDRLALSFVDSSATFYLSMSNPSLISTSSTETARASAGVVSGTAYEFVSTEAGSPETFPGGSFPATHIPLSVSSSSIYTTASYNTGYIMSGSTEEGYGTPASEAARFNAGDVRVSRYDMENIRNALGQNSFDNTKLFAITATNNNDFALITDEHNANSNVPSALSGIAGRKPSTSLLRYNDWEEDQHSFTGAREAMGTVFTSDSSNIYGLHFMNATIGTNNIVHVPNAKINGDIYQSGLDMLGDSIDFHVKQKGYIVFFAGTYFQNNNSFFSLNKVTRNSSNAITGVTQIKTIYQDNVGNLSYNPSTTTGLTKVFDTSVLTDPDTFINNAVYYFEIPVVPGEYALGSVKGTAQDPKNGAYLMYLDISTSGTQSTYNSEHQIANAPLFTQIDFQTDAFVINSCFNVGYVIPSGATKESFIITISCSSVTYSNHSYTCYEIEIINTTGSNFEISCLLMDNDSDPTNDYYYMYAITYNGGTRNQYLSSNTYTGASAATTMTPAYS